MNRNFFVKKDNKLEKTIIHQNKEKNNTPKKNNQLKEKLISTISDLNNQQRI